jgi:hypothetical protein
VSLSYYFKKSPQEVAENFQGMMRESDSFRSHAAPQHPYSHVDGIQYVDKICRMENLQEDMQEVFERIGIDCPVLPHANKTEHEHYTRCCSPKVVDFVRTHYERDIEQYGYEYQECE